MNTARYGQIARRQLGWDITEWNVNVHTHTHTQGEVIHRCSVIPHGPRPAPAEGRLRRDVCDGTWLRQGTRLRRGTSTTGRLRRDLAAPRDSLREGCVIGVARPVMPAFSGMRCRCNFGPSCPVPSRTPSLRSSGYRLVKAAGGLFHCRLGCPKRSARPCSVSKGAGEDFMSLRRWATLRGVRPSGTIRNVGRICCR